MHCLHAMRVSGTAIEIQYTEMDRDGGMDPADRVTHDPLAAWVPFWEL